MESTESAEFYSPPQCVMREFFRESHDYDRISEGGADNTECFFEPPLRNVFDGEYISIAAKNKNQLRSFCWTQKWIEHLFQGGNSLRGKMDLIPFNWLLVNVMRCARTLRPPVIECAGLECGTFFWALVVYTIFVRSARKTVWPCLIYPLYILFKIPSY